MVRQKEIEACGSAICYRSFPRVNNDLTDCAAVR